MDSPDLNSLLLHFGQKIDRIHDLVPWARTCNLLVQEQDARLTGREVVHRNELPDLRLLSDMIMDMEESIYAIDDHLDLEKKRLEKQKVRIRNLIEDLNLHLEHISSNFPLTFGQSPEKPKTQKYGINANARKSMAPKPAPSTTTGKAVSNRTGTKATTARNGRVAASSNSAPSQKVVPDKKKEASAKKPVAPPVVLSGPAIVGSKSSKPAIPVRMTKKFMTRFNHNVNNKN